MKLKIWQIVRSIEALNRIGSEKLPVGIAYDLHKNMKAVHAEFEMYEKIRIDLVRQLGSQDDVGGYRVGKDNMQAFTNEIAMLQGKEVEVNIHAINFVEFPCQISALDLTALEWMFEYPEADKIK